MPGSILEIIALVTGILCVYLQTEEKILAWPFGIISVTISAYLFFHSKLYSDVILHIVYFFLNIYGWYHWSENRNDGLNRKEIVRLKHIEYYVIPIIILIGVMALGTFMQYQFDADLAYFDAFTTVGSLVAQYLLAKKVLENWMLWIVVDIVAVPVYLYKELYFIAVLFFVYLLLCIKGYLDWNKSYQLSVIK